MNVLVTGAGGGIGQGIIKSLKMLDINESKSCLVAFKNNNVVGVLIFIFIFSFTFP